MKFTKLTLALFFLAVLPLRSWAQDTSARSLQGWLDFLGQDATLSSVMFRIGEADTEARADKIASNAQLYVWNNRFQNGTTKPDSLELVAVPDGDPTGSKMMVVAILDITTRSGLYLPWAPRYVDHVPRGNHIPEGVMSALADDQRATN